MMVGMKVPNLLVHSSIVRSLFNIYLCLYIEAELPNFVYANGFIAFFAVKRIPNS